MKELDHSECTRRRHHCLHVINFVFHVLTFAAAVATLSEVETLRRHHMRERHGK